MACNPRHLFVWRLYKFAQAFVELIWFQLYNLFCLFLLFKEFTKNQEDTHASFVTMVCEVIIRIFRMTAFWKAKVEFEFGKDR